LTVTTATLLSRIEAALAVDGEGGDMAGMSGFGGWRACTQPNVAQ
jgi:hypothetical protein